MKTEKPLIYKPLGEAVTERIKSLPYSQVKFSGEISSYLDSGRKGTVDFLAAVKQGKVYGASDTPSLRDFYLERLARLLYIFEFEPEDELINGLREIEPNFNYPPQNRDKPITEYKKASIMARTTQLSFNEKLELLTPKSRKKVEGLVDRLFIKQNQ